MTIRKGSLSLVFVITIFAALPPFAIDAYMPAFKEIGSYFGVSDHDLTKSISTYFLGFAIGMLLWGAITDRFGRRKPLIIGIIIYLASSILCSISVNYKMLLIMRFIQGLGDSSGAIISMAILRDCYKGNRLTKMMSTITMTFMIAPIVAPIIGSFIIYQTNDWKNIFHFLTIYGVVLLILSFFIPETINQEKKEVSILSNIRTYIKHFQNLPFILFTIVIGLSFAAMFSFISSSSILIISYLKLGYIQYCLLFGLNILGVILSSYYVRKKVNKNNQYKVILIYFLLAILFLIINIILSNLYNNIYIFIVFNLLATGCFVSTNILVTSIALNTLNFGYGSGNAIANLIKFSFGSLASYLISSNELKSLQIDISIQQLFFIVLSFILFLCVTHNIYFSTNKKA
ncbi:multidrug effflux MFS transporter [Francisella sp. SYW-9]|uniref:multidrug effflux MFS transporter n=1 Tax=Francisella sp. SYW-9 TaxID=2610888 RepID=UPI00123E3ADB|nr:multidrug effflux MFS transporter [Francisella sp. SYW-9]